jgi:hypothetical protein
MLTIQPRCQSPENDQDPFTGAVADSIAPEKFVIGRSKLKPIDPSRIDAPINANEGEGFMRQSRIARIHSKQNQCRSEKSAFRFNWG